MTKRLDGRPSRPTVEAPSPWPLPRGILRLLEQLGEELNRILMGHV
jgi:hypothetical protein